MTVPVRNMPVYTHRIAGITFQTESDTPIPHLQGAPFDQFVGEGSSPDAKQRIRQLDPGPPSLPPLDSREREGLARTVGFPQRWLDHPIFRRPEVRAVVQRCLEQPELVQIALAWNRAVFRNFARCELDLFYPPEKGKELADPLFVAGYRNLLAPFLVGFSAVMIHGAGVAFNGLGAVFLASDGGGKTSVVSHAPPGPVLSDDQVILRREGGSITVHGTPFGSITTGPGKAELGGLFLLEKASCFELAPVKPREALQFLWDEHLFRWYVLPKALSQAAFELLSEACHQAGVYRMRFPRAYVDWEAIGAVMAKQSGG